MKIRNKKGDIRDIMVFLVTLFVLAIGLFILAYVVPQISTGLNTAGLNSSTEGTNAVNRMSELGTITIQRGFFLLFMGLTASMMITSFFARTHPIFLFLYVFVLGITIFLAVYLGSAYQQMTSIDIFADTLASQGLINIIMNNILTVILAVGALSMVIVFAKFSTGGVQRV